MSITEGTFTFQRAICRPACVSCVGKAGGGGARAPTPPPAQRTLSVSVQPSWRCSPAGASPPKPSRPGSRQGGNGHRGQQHGRHRRHRRVAPGLAAQHQPGTTTATASAGIATFTNLGVSVAGTGYQLRFTPRNFTESDERRVRRNPRPAPVDSRPHHPQARLLSPSTATRDIRRSRASSTTERWSATDVRPAAVALGRIA